MTSLEIDRNLIMNTDGVANTDNRAIESAIETLIIDDMGCSSVIEDMEVIDILCKNVKELSRDIVSYNCVKIPNQPREREDDNREYKLYLEFDGCKKKFEHRSTQLLHRLITGDGKALYLIGLYDDGTVSGIEIDKLMSSIENIYKMAKNINGNVSKVSVYDTQYHAKYVGTVRLTIPSTSLIDDMFIY